MELLFYANFIPKTITKIIPHHGTQHKTRRFIKKNTLSDHESDIEKPMYRLKSIIKYYT